MVAAPPGCSIEVARKEGKITREVAATNPSFHRDHDLHCHPAHPVMPTIIAITIIANATFQLITTIVIIIIIVAAIQHPPLSPPS